MGDPVPSREAAERPARLKVGVIGSGRVGTALGAALERAGHHVIAVSAVSVRSLARAGRLLPGAEVMRPPELMAAADFVLLTVPDDALPGLVAGLAETEAPLAGGLVAHTSGGARDCGAGARDRARRAPARAAPGDDVHRAARRFDRLTGVSFGVTAPDELQPAGRRRWSSRWAASRWSSTSGAPALSRGAGQRRQSPGHAGGPVGRRLAAAGVSDPGQMLAPLLSAAWTTRCGWATRR